MQEVHLPHNGWRPRDYQRPLWDAWIKEETKRVLGIWHRRAGKDEVCLHGTAIKAMERPANYWHCLPEYTQARKAIWDAVNAHTGKRRIDEAFPSEIIESRNDQEMKIRFKNGSSWQVIGSDRYDSLVGAGVAGVTFSEGALANPPSWAYIRPMVAENDGWAAFITTPRGENHAFSMYQRGLERKDWFSQKLDVYQTGVMSDLALHEALEEYIDIYGDDFGRAMFDQEYRCSFSAAIQGSFYGAEMRHALDQERITELPYDSAYPVFTGWDLGFNDQTAIWFAQQKGDVIRIIDYERGRNQNLSHFARVLKDKPYDYGGHFLPHDGANKSKQTGSSYQEMLEAAGLKNIQVMSRAPDLEAVLHDINTARRMIGMATFDEKKCEHGIDSLRNYRREWDDRLKTYKQRPLHDWASDGADAFRTLAVAWDADLMVTTPNLNFKMPELVVA